MRRKEITPELLLAVQVYAQDPFSARTDRFDKPPVLLEKLRSALLQNDHPQMYINYTKKIIDEYQELNRLLPDKVQAKQNEFLGLLANKADHLAVAINPYANAKKAQKQNEAPFWQYIVNAMRYKEVRSNDILPILQQSGIKACVYCNAQLTVVVDKNTKRTKKKGCFDLDHFYPKSLYPFLCTSFFNLLPVCANCNRAKSDGVVPNWTDRFEFYVQQGQAINLSPFTFRLRHSSLLSYLAPRGTSCAEDLEIEFLPTDMADEDFCIEHNKMFHITALYDTQKDLAAELIEKKIMYSKAYKARLVDSFAKLFPSSAMIDRLLLGTYPDPADIHLRPLTKFTQDIARQIKLIR